MSKRLANRIALFIFLAAPSAALAGTYITEVMYDPSGADDGHEWVEVWNDGTPFDLSTWKLFEGGSNHGITSYAGGSTLSTGGYAIIASDPQKFLADFPSFSGQLFDTAFSGGLNNSTGETVVLRSDSLSDMDTVTYLPAWGGGGNGQSLQKVGSAFVAGVPTPGVAASGGSSDTPITPEEESVEESSHDFSSKSSTASSTSTGGYPVEPQIRVFIGDDRVVTAGASIVFEARVTGLKGERIADPRVTWSFGNGDRAEGQSVLYAFPYPGKYAVIADASSAGWGATDRLTITALPANIAIVRVTPEFIEIENRSASELDLGLWQISAGGRTFRFPPNTLMFARESVSVASARTGLSFSTSSPVSLLYPDGTLAVSYQAPLIGSRSLKLPASAPQGTSKPVPTRARTSQPPAIQQTPEELPERRELLAAPAAATPDGTPEAQAETDPLGLLPWILALLAVIGAGVVAVLLRPKGRGTTGYTIIEDHSDGG